MDLQRWLMPLALLVAVALQAHGAQARTPRFRPLPLDDAYIIGDHDFDFQGWLGFRDNTLWVQDTGWGAQRVDLRAVLHSSQHQDRNGGRVHSMKLRFAARWGRHIYVLLTVEGPSQTTDPSGRCGAGMETDLVWVHLAKGKAPERRGELISSCYADAEMDPEEAETPEGHTWTLHLDGPPQVVRFDFRHPKRSLEVISLARAEKEALQPPTPAQGR